VDDTETGGNTGDAAVGTGGGGAAGKDAGTATGGKAGTGGSTGTGGKTGAGGSTGTGGSTGSGGSTGTGGSTGSGGYVVDGGMIDAGTTNGTLGIDEAQRSGVAGFPIGVFGTAFGAAQGASTITIGGVSAPVTAWSDTLIEAKVPSVSDQTTQIVVTVSGNTVAWPFQVYSIDPSFLVQPARLENLVKGRTVVITGSYTDYGKGNPPCDGGKNVAPRFLSYNSCDGAMVPTVPYSVAMPLGQAITGDVWFNWFGDSAGYPNSQQPGNRYPAVDYTLDASANSVSGTDGTWSTVLTVTGNAYWSRIHKVTLAGATWLRWSVTGTSGTLGKVNEIGVYRVKPGSSGTVIDAWGVMGDSITAGDLNHAGDLAFWGRAMNTRGDGTEPLGYVCGLSGSKTAALLSVAQGGTAGWTLPELLAREPDIRFLGIALGINDYGYLDSQTTAATNRSNLDKGIQNVFAAGRVPVLARISDTIDSVVQPPTTPTMKLLILKNEDELAAQYRLIPGPDFYTYFRKNPGSIGGDGIHHASGDFNEEILWAQAIVSSGL
jgi:hypothetical protein